MAEYHFLHSFKGPDINSLLTFAQQTERDYPFDYRFRNRPVRAAIEMAMAGHLPLQNLQPFLISALKTDPLDLELIWNIGVWQHEIGNLEGSRDVLIFASRLAPGNALIARAVLSTQQENTK